MTGATEGPTSRQLVLWRRRALDQQLPLVSFPGGVGAPSVVFLGAIAALSIVVSLLFALQSRPGVPQAIVDSQRDVVTRLARSVNTAYTATVDQVRRAVEAQRAANAVDNERLLAEAVPSDGPWTGGAVLDTATRQVLAKTGVPVPTSLLPQIADGTVADLSEDRPAMLLAVPVDQTRTLVAYQPLLLRSLPLNPQAHHGLFGVGPDGRHVVLQGVTAVTPATLPLALAGLASISEATAKVVPIRESTDRELVVSAAPLGTTGLVLVSILVGEVEAGVPVVEGTMLGLSLFAVALISFALMRMSIVAPVRRLLRRAKAHACGDDRIPDQRLVGGEVARIATALATASGGPVAATRRRRPGALVRLTLAAVLTCAWSAAVIVTTVRAPDPTMPRQLVLDEESRAEAASTVLGNLLDAGLSAVSQIVGEHPKPDPATIGGVLRRDDAADRRFRSLYLVDATGANVAVAGRDPLRPPGPVPGDSGIVLEATSGRLPVIYAYRLADNGNAVVGEFEIDRLRGVLRQVDGRARVVDAEMRTILDSEGYLAFEPLRGAVLRAAAIETLAGGTVGSVEISKNASTLIASSAMQSPPAVAHLEWSIVTERNVSALGLPSVIAARWSLLMAAIAAAIALLALAWYALIFVRPLRRMARDADAITEGDIETPLAPRRHDEIGAVAICLEICRQVAHTGSARFGGAVRLRGPGTDFTQVLPRVPKQPRTHGRDRRHRDTESQGTGR